MRLKLYLLLIFIFAISKGHSQSTFVPVNSDYYHLIDRYEIKRGKLSEGFHYSIRPFERKAVVQLTDSVLADSSFKLTSRDRFNLNFLRQDSREWLAGYGQKETVDTSVSADSSGLDSLRRRKKHFSRWMWVNEPDFYGYTDEDFDLHVNLATDNFLGAESASGSGNWFSARGVELRGMINKKLGFYTFVADNQGFFPRYVRNYTSDYNFPGEGLTKIGRNGSVDFLSARGYITFKPIKSINVQFGHDRNFFGSGYRSLLLSDNSSPYLFLRLDTKIGRFHYTNLWTSMINDQDPSVDLLRKKKYMAIHHLAINLSDKFSIGVFEAEVFHRDSTGGGFDLNYLNPIIFYRYVESYIGSSDNALLGFDFRWLPRKQVSVYGQFILDELLTSELFSSKGSWTNKHAIQVGSKYVDAFGVNNLDVQLEFNQARPYIYSHRNGGKNYVHYRQPMAHPLGANFREWIATIRYQPVNRLSVYGTLMYAMRGVDQNGSNWGSNPLLDYETREQDYGNRIGQGLKQRITTWDLRASYMWFHNFYLEARVYSRVEKGTPWGYKTRAFNFGIRYNIPYRQQTF